MANDGFVNPGNSPDAWTEGMLVSLALSAVKPNGFVVVLGLSAIVLRAYEL